MVTKRLKTEKTKPSAGSQTTAKVSRAAPQHHSRTIRETVESIAVAFVLAFLFRTFEAEAFVIPTGSMAPTLQGRHKDLICPECKFRYRVSASNEVDERGQTIEGRDIVGGTCPNCRFTLDFENAAEASRKWPSYNGDRILVAKFPYDFADPDRWDVVVFHFPGDSKMNYIKRLVGRPHETVRIRHGDIYIKPDDDQATTQSGSEPDSEGFDIARKPPDRVRAMSQTVYDNDYVVDAMTEAGWPLRWQSWPAGRASPADAWQSPDGGRSFTVSGTQNEAWIRYQHFIAFPDDWQDIGKGHVTGAPHPRLVADFYAYNTSEQRGARNNMPASPNWVGDLVLEATINAQSPQGVVLLDLVRAGRHLRCEIELTSGEARLKIGDSPDFQPSAKTAIRGAGRHRVTFANVDRKLFLWVDGSPVEFNAPTTYAAVGDDIPTSDDLAPAGIGSRGAALEVEHLLLKRDVYYIATRDTMYGGMSDYEPGDAQKFDLLDYFAEPELWSGDSLFADRREVTFPLEADQFFVLGDNSPASKDSRLWSQGVRSWSKQTHSWSSENSEFYVSRELLIGKALFIYWPHGLNRVPYLNIPVPFGLFPNFKDMGFVR